MPCSKASRAAVESAPETVAEWTLLLAGDLARPHSVVERLLAHAGATGSEHAHVFTADIDTPADLARLRAELEEEL